MKNLKILFETGDFSTCIDICHKILQEDQYKDKSAAQFYLGKSLLSQMSINNAFDENIYCKALIKLMESYNTSHSDECFSLISKLCYLPNEHNMNINYTANANKLSKEHSIHDLPAYENLPILLFPITNDYAIIFSKKTRHFYINEISESLHELYKSIILNSYDDYKNVFIKKYNFLIKETELEKTFNVLSLMSKNNIYDDNFFHLLDFFRKSLPYCEMGDLYLAKYYLQKKEYAKALEISKLAYNKRLSNCNSIYLLAKCYEYINDYNQAAYYYIRYLAFFVNMDEDVSFECSKKVREIINNPSSTYFNSVPSPIYAPIYQKVSLVDSMKFLGNMFIGRYLYNDPKKCNNFWVGLYNDNDPINSPADTLYSLLKPNADINIIRNQRFSYDIIKSIVGTKYKCTPKKGETFILPIAGQHPTNGQVIKFKTPSLNETFTIGRNEFSFFRVDETTEINAKEPCAFGNPILLKHHPKRKKLILNILIDALSWSNIIATNYQDVPNIVTFFKKGIIFNNNFSVSEYTYPSFATIETGLYPHHSQIISFYSQLDKKHRTISEQIKNLGYNCTATMADTEHLFSDVMRGYDRIIANNLILDSTLGISRTIEHLEAFSECDNFVFLHCTDAHPFCKVQYPISLSTQTKLSLKDRISDIEDKPSVFLKSRPINVLDNNHKIKNIDKNLKILFDYIETHYNDDEYIIHLYSDHGTSVYNDNDILLNQYQTGAALMMRGSGIPAKGFCNELTSTLDIYPIIEHNLGGFNLPNAPIDGNLPAILGGKRREYTISYSMFAKQRYSMCIRNYDYEFYLVVATPLRQDYIIDMRHFFWRLFKRDKNHTEIFNETIKEYFLNIAYDHIKSFAVEQFYDPSFIKNL